LGNSSVLIFPRFCRDFSAISPLFKKKRPNRGKIAAKSQHNTMWQNSQITAKSRLSKTLLQGRDPAVAAIQQRKKMIQIEIR